MNMFRRFTLAASLLAAAPALAQTPTVDAPAGKVSGRQEGDISVFQGIPYALPPVKGHRWQPPQPMPKWEGTRAATAFGPACIQPDSKTPNIYSPTTPLPQSEDCLTLNIWAPKNPKSAPVFFWIHGGALVSGSSREAMYDGRKLAERGAIVVSINYRLGVLGWLAHPQLSTETAQKVSGNYGLLDQIMALYWVHNNIAAFGGDPKNVTIAGESAGALSVMYLLTSPIAKGLFHKAIAQSAYMLPMPDQKKQVYGLPGGETVGQMLQAGLQMPDIRAMRGMDPKELTNKAAALGFGPWGVVDGFALPEQMVTAFDGGRQAKVPLLTGFNQGEIRSLLMLAAKAPGDAAAYEKEVRERYGELADAYLKLYPASDYKEGILANTRDALYGWTTERLARKQTAAGQKAYVYLFDHGYPAMDEKNLHAFHASELPYVFGTFDGVGPLWPKIPETPAEHALSDAMIGYWTSFAATGAPKASGAPDWPVFGATRSYLHFTDTPKAEAGLLPGMFELHETVMCRRKATGTIPWMWNSSVASPKLPAKAPGCD
ncbi:MAG: carboxylesterase family protein [Sphingomonadales bacterium]|nr:MAG: carboxylesterase family protein [Sphingomonadales bacterium]